MRYAVFVLACSLPVAAQQDRFGQDQKSDNPLNGNREAAEAGRKLYMAACSACHGQTGEGGRGPNLSDGRLVRRLSDTALFQSIQNGVPGTDMPAFKLGEEKLWQVVTYVRSLGSPAYEARVEGSPDKGGIIFWGKGQCSSCHMIRGRGGYLGPDLSNAGMRRSLKQLREAILDPSARLAEGFVTADATLKDGRTVAGVAKYNTNYTVQILDKSGTLHSIAKQDLGELKLSLRSRMPGVYKQRLSAGELQDLLAYLSRQAIREESQRMARTN